MKTKKLKILWSNIKKSYAPFISGAFLGLAILHFGWGAISLFFFMLLMLIMVAIVRTLVESVAKS